MWNDQKQQQLDALRQRELSQLTDTERQTLVQLFSELEEEEWQQLRPTLSELRAEQAQLHRERGEAQVQNAVLAAITERQADLLARAKVQLNALLNEQTVLNREYERAVGQPIQDV